MFIAKEIDSLGGSIENGEIIEIVSFNAKHVNRHLFLALLVELCENATILPQDVIDATNVIAVSGLDAVVEAASALVGAELFVGPAMQGLSTCQAGFLHCIYHSAQRVSLYPITNGCCRIGPDKFVSIRIAHDLIIPLSPSLHHSRDF